MIKMIKMFLKYKDNLKMYENFFINRYYAILSSPSSSFSINSATLSNPAP